MARKKQEFKPDPEGTGLLSKLYITPAQRLTALKWALYGALFLAVLVVQDVILSRLTLFGGRADLTSAVILLICVIEGADSGGIFALLASVFYVLAGTAPGEYAVVLITALGITAAVFRQNFLYRSFMPRWLCTWAAVLVYQLTVFLIGVFMTQTNFSRFTVFLMNALLAGSCLLPLYPIAARISRIGGETWKE